jgi:alpha-L-rhamnosidase
LRVTIPLNTTATVRIPTNDVATIQESGKSAKTSSGVRFVLSGEGFAEYELGSGQYVFVSKITPGAKKSN